MFIKPYTFFIRFIWFYNYLYSFSSCYLMINIKCDNINISLIYSTDLRQSWLYSTMPVLIILAKALVCLSE